MTNKTPTDIRYSQILLTGVDFDSRSIWISGPITEETAARVIPAIKLMDETKGEIRVYINSGGGDSSAGFAIYGMLCSTKNRVRTIGVGDVYSIAAVILQGGDKRTLTIGSEVMVHNGSLHHAAGEPVPPMGTEAIAKMMEELKRSDMRYYTVLWKSCNGKMGLVKIREMCTKETFLKPEAAVEVGLADEVVETL